MTFVLFFLRFLFVCETFVLKKLLDEDHLSAGFGPWDFLVRCFPDLFLCFSDYNQRREWELAAILTRLASFVNVIKYPRSRLLLR